MSVWILHPKILIVHVLVRLKAACLISCILVQCGNHRGVRFLVKDGNSRHLRWNRGPSPLATKHTRKFCFTVLQKKQQIENSTVTSRTHFFCWNDSSSENIRIGSGTKHLVRTHVLKNCQAPCLVYSSPASSTSPRMLLTMVVTCSGAKSLEMSTPVMNSSRRTRKSSSNRSSSSSTNSTFFLCQHPTGWSL